MSPPSGGPFHRRDGALRPIAHRDLTVLEVDSPAVLQELRAVVPLDDYVLAVIDECRLAVDPARTGELAHRLATRGLAPLIKSVARSAPAADRSLSWDRDEDTQPRLPPPAGTDEG
jgi:hypothetical protein